MVSHNIPQGTFPCGKRNALGGSAQLHLMHTCLFDKINRCFKFTVVSVIAKNYTIGTRSHNCTMNPRVLTTWTIETQGFEGKPSKLCTFYSLNFVLKAGILNPLTSPSILWTILFVCTSSCKMDEIHLLYWQGFTFTIAWKHRVFGSF